MGRISKHDTIDYQCGYLYKVGGKKNLNNIKDKKTK